MDLIIFLNVINYIKNHTHSPTYKSDFTLESVGQGDKIFVEIIRVSYHGHSRGNISKNPSTTKGSATANAVSRPPDRPCCCQPTTAATVTANATLAMSPPPLMQRCHRHPPCDAAAIPAASTPLPSAPLPLPQGLSQLWLVAITTRNKCLQMGHGFALY